MKKNTNFHGANLPKIVPLSSVVLAPSVFPAWENVCAQAYENYPDASMSEQTYAELGDNGWLIIKRPLGGRYKREISMCVPSVLWTWVH